MQTDGKARIAITYCTQCQWLLRPPGWRRSCSRPSVTEIGEVALIPGTGGVFQITCDDELIWEQETRWRLSRMSRH